MEEPSPAEETYPAETPPGPAETPSGIVETPSAPTPSGPDEMPPAPSPPPPSSSPQPPSHSPPPASPSPSSPSHPSCPEDLFGPYEYPHLIIPVSSSSPSEPSGSSYNGQVSATTCTLFNFDIPASMAGKSCSTIFMLPLKSELETSDYKLSGSGVCTITRLDGPVTEQSTWDDKPEAEAQVQ
ncbi:But2 multi-domain protein [Pyrenophora tritici-repentis]|nr:But2 multi-domain protein [Pyrenophora tritici-repentis]